MKKRVVVVGAIVLVAAAGGVWMFARSRSSSAGQYRLAILTCGTIQQTVSATGTMSAVKTVQVGTRVSGQVAELYADFNDHVRKGQLLARIDPTLQRQAVTDAQAQLGKAQAQYDQANAEEDRNAPLFEQKFIAASDFEMLQMNTKVSSAAVRSAQIALDEAKQNLAYTDIVAPISGVVVVRSVDLGQTVAASLSAPQIFLIAQDLSQIQILAAVDESDIAAIKDSQTVKFTVEAYPDTFTARVSQVRLQSQLTDNVVNYTVVVIVENKDGRLLPGMTATVQFVTGSATDVLVVPNLALRFKPSDQQLAASGLAASQAGGGGGTPDTTGGSGGSRNAGSAGVSGGRGNAPNAAGAATRAKRPAVGGPGSFGTLYVLDASKKLKRIRVRIGLTDGQRTEVSSDSLSEGMQIVIGVGGSTTTAATSATSTNPLTPQRVGAPGRGP
jgi:HlyD family secretion protein